MLAALQRDEEFYEDCRKYSSLHGIGELNEDELLNCIHIRLYYYILKRGFWSRGSPASDGAVRRSDRATDSASSV